MITQVSYRRINMKGGFIDGASLTNLEHFFLDTEAKNRFSNSVLSDADSMLSQPTLISYDVAASTYLPLLAFHI